MFLKRSRYSAARPFAAGEGGREIFKGVRPREIHTSAGVIEHTVREGDRLDLMALYYYNDDRSWWIIADANPEFVFAGLMVDPEMVGDVLVIPKIKGS